LKVYRICLKYLHDPGIDLIKRTRSRASIWRGERWRLYRWLLFTRNLPHLFIPFVHCKRLGSRNCIMYDKTQNQLSSSMYLIEKWNSPSLCHLTSFLWLVFHFQLLCKFSLVIHFTMIWLCKYLPDILRVDCPLFVFAYQVVIVYRKLNHILSQFPRDML